MVELTTKPGANVNAVPQWKLAQKVSVAQKFLRFTSHGFQVHRVSRSDPYSVSDLANSKDVATNNVHGELR